MAELWYIIGYFPGKCFFDSHPEAETLTSGDTSGHSKHRIFTSKVNTLVCDLSNKQAVVQKVQAITLPFSYKYKIVF